MSSSKNKQSYDAAVIGGGAIGLFAAWRAAQRGLRTIVLERGRLGGGTSRVAAGMLAPVAEATFGEERLVAFKTRSALDWETAAAELADATGRPTGYRRTGTLYLARDADAAAALEREAGHRRSLGLKVRRLLPSEARDREPALAPSIRAALELPTDHAVDPRALCDALAVATRAAGGHLREGADVAALASAGNRVTGVELVGGENIAADQVVIAAGCWSAQIDGIAPGARPPLRPVKGQIIGLRDPAGAGLTAAVLRTDDVYVVPRGDGRYVLGASVEERGWDTSVTALATYELLRDAAEVLPGILELEIEEAIAGLRPATPDNAPVIGRGETAGLIWATGHYRNGILLAPATASIVVSLLSGEDPGEAAAPFSPQRFRERVPA